MKMSGLRVTACVAVASAVLACVGCSSPGGYLRDRGLDLLDTFEIGVSAGKGVRAEVRYGFGVWGLGMTQGWRARVGQRALLTKDFSLTFAPVPFPVSALLIPVANLLGQSWPMSGDVLPGGWEGAVGWSLEEETPLWPGSATRGLYAREQRYTAAFIAWPRGDSCSIGAEIHLLVGARVRVLPVEIVDFVAGLFGWDLLGDDLSMPLFTGPRWTRILTAARVGDLDALRALIAQGEDVDARNARGQTPLGIAVEAEQWEAVGLLMDHGATFSYAESPYLSFTLAAERGDLAGVEVLMRDERVRSVEKDTGSGLRAAAAAGQIEVVRFLLRSGVPAGLRDREGRTALSYALQYGHADVAELLRSYGAEGQAWPPRE